MQSQISEISKVFVQVSVEVPWADVEKAMEGSYSELGRTAKVRGFRPGKVPRNVLKQLFGARVRQEVLNSLVESGLGKAVEQHQLAVVAVPPLESTPQLKQGEPLTFTAKLEVRPKIEQVDIEGIALTRSMSAIEEGQVDEALEQLRNQHAEVVAVDPPRAAVETDILTCDYTVTIEGKERPELAASARPIELAGGLLPELKAGLVGKQPGDQARVEVTFPQGQGEFAGKLGVFEITITEIKQKVLPALDDEFAKDVESGSLAELRQKTRERLEQGARQEAEGVLREQLVDKVLEKNPVEVPPSLVTQQQQAMLQEYVRMVRMTGQPMNLGEELMNSTKQDAERRVRAALVLGAIARLKGIRVEAADLDRQLEQMAQRSGKHIAKLRAELQGEQREALESQILEEKLLEYLLGQATITDAAA
jgi:trigger factor